MPIVEISCCCRRLAWVNKYILIVHGIRQSCTRIFRGYRVCFCFTRGILQINEWFLLSQIALSCSGGVGMIINYSKSTYCLIARTAGGSKIGQWIYYVGLKSWYSMHFNLFVKYLSDYVLKLKNIASPPLAYWKRKSFARCYFTCGGNQDSGDSAMSVWQNVIHGRCVILGLRHTFVQDS